jgi:hypothetical protein
VSSASGAGAQRVGGVSSNGARGHAERHGGQTRRAGPERIGSRGKAWCDHAAQERILGRQDVDRRGGAKVDDESALGSTSHQRREVDEAVCAHLGRGVYVEAHARRRVVIDDEHGLASERFERLGEHARERKDDRREHHAVNGPTLLGRKYALDTREGTRGIH